MIFNSFGIKLSKNWVFCLVAILISFQEVNIAAAQDVDSTETKSKKNHGFNFKDPEDGAVLKVKKVSHIEPVEQEKANKRLNFLTIIQAIFVPLTLMTGIYGMNFVNMPELNWHFGYFFLLGVLVLIASVFIRYFYKNGWFDKNI